jgi:hypothetical protein
MNIEIKYQPDIEDYRNGRRLLYFDTKTKRILFPIYMGILIIVGIFYFTYKTYSTNDMFFPIAGIIVVLILIYILFLNYIHLENIFVERYEKEKVFMEEFRIILDDDNITLSTKYNRNIIPWKYINEVRENEDTILIIYLNNCGINIPKRIFNDIERQSELKEFIENIKKPYNYKKCR